MSRKRKRPTSQHEYDGNDLPKTLYPWEHSVLDRFTNDVNWLVCPNVVGKSEFAKYLDFHQLSMTLNWATPTMVARFERFFCNNVVFDLTRCRPFGVSNKSFFNAIFDLRTGVLETKRKTQLKIHPQRIWIFSAFPPPMEFLHCRFQTIEKRLPLGGSDKGIKKSKISNRTETYHSIQTAYPFPNDVSKLVTEFLFLNVQLWTVNSSFELVAYEQ